MNQYETDDNGFVISGYRSRIVSKDDVLIVAESGLALSTLSVIALKEEITGFEFLSG